MTLAVRSSLLLLGLLLSLAAPATAVAQDLQACSCTGSACGNGGAAGEQGDIFIEVSDAEVDEFFETGDDSGWTCVVPAAIRDLGDGELACFCEVTCGGDGIGGDADFFDVGLTLERVNDDYGGFGSDNPTGWLCGNFRGSVAEDGPPGFEVNAGLNDAWADTGTDGQGFFIAVFPDTGAMSLAWFTFDVERPPQDVTAMLGGPGQRWLTAIGTWDGNVATLAVESVTGGVFNEAQPAVDRVMDYGTITIEFHDCNNGTLTYDIPALMLMGTIEITRIVPDNAVVCEALSGS